MGFLGARVLGHGESERTDEWKNQERERGFVVCVVNSQTWGGALVRPVLSDFVKSRPHNGQCTHILIPLGQILSEPSPLTHTKSNPSIPPRVAFIGGTHARPLSTNLSACDILSVQISHTIPMCPHDIHHSLSFISPPRLSVVQLSLCFFIRSSAPLPALLYLAPTSLITTHLLRRGAFLPYNSLRSKRGRRRGSAAPSAAPS